MLAASSSLRSRSRPRPLGSAVASLQLHPKRRIRHKWSLVMIVSIYIDV